MATKRIKQRKELFRPRPWRVTPFSPRMELPRPCPENGILFFFVLPVLWLSGPWLFYSARLRKTSRFFFGRYRMQEERKRRALTKGQYAWAQVDLRHFKGAHEDRAMRRAQKKVPMVACLQWTKSAQVAPGIMTFMWNCKLTPTTGHILCYASHAKGPHLLASSS